MECSSGRKPLREKIVIAIDGHSSSGKSTFARAIAARLGYAFIDTGAMYRAVTLYALRHGAITNGEIDTRRLVGMLGDMDMRFRADAAGSNELYLNGEPAGDSIRTIEVSDLVSRVSSIPEVRAKLIALQQTMGREKGVVMDGRDIGTVVFPDAELKIFLTADPAERARRRYEELRERGESVSREEIERNIRERDRLDESRAESPLKKAADALVLDNTAMSQDEQMQWVMDKICGLTIKPPR